MFKPQPPIRRNESLTDGQFLAITIPFSLLGAALLFATILGLIEWDIF